ncbi:MAG: ChbG/HpnK family deacetylase [Formivibrio sp.]|nr:ChbG/HpnK family deacetylase [Formivibrio sp.]
MNRTVTLCADDFAQSAAISEAILELLSVRRLSATSVFSQSPLWPHLAPQLATQSSAEIGLHFNLTHPFDDTARPLSHWLIQSQLHRLPSAWLADQVRKQLDAFTTILGRLPDFIDGHQHVHALPQIRDALLSTLAELGMTTPYLRAPDRLSHPGDSRSKAFVLKTLCRGFACRAMDAGYRVPAWFGGLYSLSPEADYAALMAKWLTVAPESALLMCHPGNGSDNDDPIAAARRKEFRYLSSDRFAECCESAGVLPGPFQSNQSVIMVQDKNN